MGKNPAFQFYPSDWTRDLDDQDLEVEGAWIRICCRLWWSETKGQLTKTLSEWSNVLRTHPNKTGVILKTLLKKSIADGEFLDNQNITIISRRMVRDSEISQLRRRVGLLGGNPNLIKKELCLDNQNSTKRPTKKGVLHTSSSTSKNICKRTFQKPTPEEIKNYCEERQNKINFQTFYDWYEANGWKVGKNPMRDWKACIRTWETRGYDNAPKSTTTITTKKHFRTERDAINDDAAEAADRITREYLEKQAAAGNSAKIP